MTKIARVDAIQSRDYYRATVARPLSYPELVDDANVDVCVIGAGLAGLTTALELARSGLRVVVLEAEVVAWGASGRNGGAVAPGYATSYGNIARRVGADAARALFRLSIEGVKIVRRNIEDLGIGEAALTPGRIRLSRIRASKDARGLMEWMHRQFDYDLTFCDMAEVREMLRTDKYFFGLYDSHAFHIHPLNYALGLARAIEALGGRLFEHSRALKVTRSNGVYATATSHGRIQSRYVVYTTGGYTDSVAPRLEASYVPIFTYVMVTQPSTATVGTAIRVPYAVGDTRRASDYYRVVDDGQRILWGGMISTHQLSDAMASTALHRRMVDTYPQLASLGVECAWSGTMAYARHLMPQIGQMGDGAWYCTCFGGHGINTTAIGGKLVADAITASSDEYRRFAPFGLAWNGSVVGKLAVQFTYWYLQARDAITEARDHARDRA